MQVATSIVLLFAVIVLASGRKLKLPELDFELDVEEDGSGSVEGSVSMLEMTSKQGFQTDTCASTGDTHASTFPDVPRTNVMGDREWVVVEGPTSPSVPKFFVQATQKAWLDCGRSNPEITLIKDVAVQCGNAYVLITTPNYTNGCNQRKYYPVSEGEKIDFPKIFVRGTSVQGTFYNGADYSKDPGFQTNSRTQLSTGFPGQTMTITTNSNPCGRTTCRVNSVPGGGTYIDVTVTCADTTTRTYSLHGGSSWWSFGIVTVAIPRQTQRSALIRQGATDGNLEGGYCGGWSPVAREKLLPLHNTCRTLPRQGFYHPIDGTTPTECVRRFTTTNQNSLFARFESWSNGAYNSNWTTTEARASTVFSEDDMLAATATCASFLRTQMPSLTLTNSPQTPWELAVREKTKDCAEDRVFGLTWTGEQLKSQLCEIASDKIQQERKDIFCASSQFKSRCDTVSPRNLASTIAQAKSAEDIFRLREILQAAKRSSLEVISSADNLGYWNINECSTQIVDSRDLNTTNCVDYRFIDTARDMSAPDTAFIYGMLSTVDDKGQAILLDSVLSTPTAVIILGAPSNAETDAAVPRVNRTSTGFTVYIAESKCSKSFAHQPEYVPYMVLDTAKTYSNFFLMTVVATSEWQTVTFPAMEDVTVLATIQSINNPVINCCPPVRGYVTVRMRDVGTTSLSIRLQTDKHSEKMGVQVQRETVALLFIRGSRGTISRIPWLAGRIRTAATIGNGLEAPTSTVQIALNSDSFRKPPFVFVQTMTFDDPESMNLRTRNNMLNNRYDFYMDEDTCDPDNTSRAHSAETVGYFALARV